MILTYYQAVDLMSELPVLLSPAFNENIQETVFKKADDQNNEDADMTGIIEMWAYTSSAIEVNGADFY
jgi:hypothetical protein